MISFIVEFTFCFRYRLLDKLINFNSSVYVLVREFIVRWCLMISDRVIPFTEAVG